MRRFWAYDDSGRIFVEDIQVKHIGSLSLTLLHVLEFGSS